MNDEQLIELFFARSESALAELHSKYGKLCHSLSYQILKNREDAQECVNDAYLRVWNAIPPARPNPLVTFVCRIVRNLSLKRYEYNTAKKRNSNYDVALDELEECIPSTITVEAELENKELAVQIEKFLDSLSRENRVIFLRRYWFADSYEDIARRTGLSEKNVSVRLVRTRKQLKEYLENLELM